MPKPSKGGDTGESTIRGSRRDDTLISTAGDDLVKAGSGQDTLVLSGSVWDYDWSKSSEKGVDWKLTDTSGGTGTDKLSSVEILQFDDATIVLGEDLPMEIIDAPTTFSVTEDEDASFTFLVRDLDDNDVDVKFETGFWHQDSAFGDMTVLHVNDSSFYRWGPQSTQREYEFSFSYDEQGASLAEGEIHIETVTLMVTTTSSEDFFGYTEEETRAVTFDVEITGVNDAPTISGDAAFWLDDTSEQRFDLSALGNDIDSDDDGASLNYEIVNISQIYVDYRYPFAISTEGSELVVSPDGLPVGLTTDEQSWAAVELQAVDRHGAVSVDTVTVNVTLQGTATAAARASVIDTSGAIDLSSVTFGAADVFDYGTAILFGTQSPEFVDVTALQSFTLGDDSRLISAGSISSFAFNTDETTDSDLGLGADTLVFDLTSATQQVFALNSVTTGWGEDAVVLSMTGADEMRFYGATIDTGAQSDQIVVRADATSGAWFNPDINTGSGHDVVDLQFTHLGTSGELLSDAGIVLGSGDDTLSFVLSSDPSVTLASSIELHIAAGDGNDVIHVDTATVTADDLSAVSALLAEAYPGGTQGTIYLGAGDDSLSLALNAPASGSTDTGLVVYGGEGFDEVTLLELTAAQVSATTVTDDIGFGWEGTALTTDDGQLIELFGVDELVFADGETWLL